MASTLELLIRAKLDATGLNQLETQLSKVTDSVSKMMQGQQRKFNAGDFILSDGDVDSVRASVAEIDSIIQDLKGRMINAFATGGEEATLQFSQQMKKLEALKKTLTTALPAEGFDKGGFQLNQGDINQAIANIKRLEKEITEFQSSATAAFARGEKAAGRYFKGMAAEAKKAKRELESVMPKDAPLIDSESFIGKPGDLANVKDQIDDLSQQITGKMSKARAAYAAQSKDAGDVLVKEAEALKGHRSQLEKTIPVIKKSGDAIQNLLTNRITRLGFGIFAVQSSIQTFTTLVKGMFDTISEGAATLDRTRSFEILLSGEGIDPTGMANKLKAASQGLLTLDQAMQKTIQLAKAGFPEMAKNSDALLKIATNAAIVSGDVSQAATVYDKLVRGIIRGSPRLIDDADIILKLGDANERYAASIGKTVEQLTAADKVQATYNAVLNEGLRINEMADQMDSTSVKVQKLKTEWEEFTTVLKESVAIVLVSNAELEESMDRTLNIESIAGSGAAGLEVIKQMFSSLQGLGALVGTVLAVVKHGLVLIAKTAYVAFRAIGAGLVMLVEKVVLFGLGLAEAQAQFLGLGKLAGYFTGQIEDVEGSFNSLAASMENNKKMFAELGGDFSGGLLKDIDAILKSAGIIRGEIAKGSPIGTDGAAGSARESNEEIKKLLQERAKMSADIERERTTKIRDINHDHKQKMVDIARDLSDQLADIKQDLSDKLRDLAQARSDKLVDIDKDLADKLADVNTDLADKLADIQGDGAEKRQDAIEDYNKDKEDAEKAHQKKINDILRQYEASRLQALIDRDARGLFEAQTKRDEDLESAEESAKDKRETELEELEDKLKDIEKAEEKARAAAIKRADEQRKDAIKAAEEKRQDAQKAYDRARRDALQDADRRKRDARQAAADARREAIESQKEARRDLQQWYADKKRDLAEFHADELRSYQGQHNMIGDMTADFLNNQLQMTADFVKGFDGIIRNSTWTGVGGNTDPSTGEEFPDWHNPANVYAGGRCNRGSSQITTGADGGQYVCIGNSWRAFTGVDQVAGTSGGNTMALPSGGVAQTAGGTGGNNMQLTIVSDGDNTLQKILEEVSYDAFIQVVG